LKRRDFIKHSTLVLGSLSYVTKVRPADRVAEKAAPPVLLVVFLRGGADGLNIVVPFAEPEYVDLRPDIGIAEPGKPQGALDLDGFFGFHPRLTGLHTLFQSGGLAVIHACGSHHPTRSHFDAMDVMESGSGTVKLHEGWLNRYLQVSSQEGGVFRAVAINPSLPLSLSGEADALALSGLDSLQLSESLSMQTYLKAVEDLYAPRNDLLGRAARSALQAVDLGGRVLDPESYKPAHGADYGSSDFGVSLKAVAQMIKADVGLELAAVDLGGWDTHTNQGGGEGGSLSNVLGILDTGLLAFFTDLGNRMNRVAVLVMTEFGRTARQNGSGGTDHGHGSMMLVLGGRILGGRVYGDWPGIRRTQLYEARDLAVTTDYRRVLGEVLENHMDCISLDRVFPDFSRGEEKPLYLFG
jgi:uncharacterized protein (DUF1501 family)